MKPQDIARIANSVVGSVGIARDAGLLGCGAISSPVQFDTGILSCLPNYQCGGAGLFTCCEDFACASAFACPGPDGFRCDIERTFSCGSLFDAPGCAAAYIPEGACN